MKVRLIGWSDPYEDAWPRVEPDYPAGKHDLTIEIPRALWWLYRAARLLDRIFWNRIHKLTDENEA